MCFAIDTGEQKMEIITMAYKSKGLGLKEEKPDVFPGIVGSRDGVVFLLRNNSQSHVVWIGNTNAAGATILKVENWGL